MFPWNPPTGPLRRPSDHPVQSIFSFFFKKNFLLLPHIFGVHNCLDHNCFKNGRNAKLPVISRRAINVTEMRETLRAHNRQIWNHKCIIARCKPQARTKTRASIRHIHTRTWSLSAACLGLNRYYTCKKNKTQNAAETACYLKGIFYCDFLLGFSSGCWWRLIVLPPSHSPPSPLLPSAKLVTSPRL